MPDGIAMRHKPVPHLSFAKIIGVKCRNIGRGRAAYCRGPPIKNCCERFRFVVSNVLANGAVTGNLARRVRIGDSRRGILIEVKLVTAVGLGHQHRTAIKCRVGPRRVSDGE